MPTRRLPIHRWTTRAAVLLGVLPGAVAQDIEAQDVGAEDNSSHAQQETDQESGAFTQELRFSRPDLEAKLEIGDESTRRIKIENLGERVLRLHRIEVSDEWIQVSKWGGAREATVPLGANAELELDMGPGEFLRLEVTLSTAGQEEGELRGEIRASHSASDEPLRLPVLVEVIPEEGEDYDPTAGSQRPDRLVTQGPPPEIVFDHYVHDFGSCLEGTKLHTFFEFRNEGEGELIIQTIRRQCHCSVAGIVLASGPVSKEQLKKEPIGRLAPGESGQILIELDTAGLPGQLTKQFFVYTNDPARGHESTLVIGADVEKGFVAKPSNSMTFRKQRGLVRAGQGAEQVILLSSEKLGDFEVLGHKIAAPSPLDVEYRRVRRPKTPGTHWELKFRLRENALFGRHFDSITFEIGHPEVKEYKMSYAFEVLADVDFTGTTPDNLKMGAVRPPQNIEGKFLIENHNAAVPYVPTSIEIRPSVGDAEPYTAEFVELVAGERYEIVFKVVGPPPLKFFKGDLIVKSAHPQLPEKKLGFSGIYLGK